jgi:lipid-A-disaccharide synthase-like uncharacterized protein
MSMTLSTNLENGQTSTWTGPRRHSDLAWDLVTPLGQKLYSGSNFYFYSRHSPRVSFNYSFRSLIRCCSSLTICYMKHKRKRKGLIIHSISCKFKSIINLMFLQKYTDALNSDAIDAHITQEFFHFCDYQILIKLHFKTT